MQAQLDEQKRIEAEENAAKSEENTTWYGDSGARRPDSRSLIYAEFLGVSYVYGGTSPRDLTAPDWSITVTDISDTG
jgi:hypothetical protein